MPNNWYTNANRFNYKCNTKIRLGKPNLLCYTNKEVNHE